MDTKHLGDQSPSTGEDTIQRVLRTLTESDGVVARFERPCAVTPTTIALISDPHIATEEKGTWKMFHRTQERFQETLAALTSQEIDCLLLSGDLTKDGARNDLEWIHSELEGIDIPYLAVPGNHDVTEFPVTYFADRFTSSGFPVHHQIADIDLIGLNSALTPDESGGDAVEDIVSDEQLEWLEETLPDTSNPIVVTHHNLPGLHDRVGDVAWDPHSPVGNADAVLDVLSRHDVPLHLSGHVHLLARTVTEGVNGLIAPALSSFPQSYLLLEIDDTGTTVRCRSTADEDGIEEAYQKSRTYSTRSKVISDLTTEQLADLPLVDERGDTLD